MVGDKMKKIILIAALLICFSAKLCGQTISTIAGGGTGGDGIPATSSSICDPNGLVFDADGNLYFTENLCHKIRKINTSGIISTIAGTGIPGFSGDSWMATLAQINQPCGIAIDSLGNIFFADAQNSRIRKINATTGIIQTVVGNGIAGFSGDSGMATSCSLNFPGCVCFDKFGNLYVGDYGNKRIRKVNTVGIINTIAGNGMIGWSGDGGPATNAKCNPYNSMCTDNNGNLFIAEWSNYVVRKIDSFGIISTVAGDTSSYVYNGDDQIATHANMGPDYIAIGQSGNLYISDYNNNRVRWIDDSGIIHTVAGNGGMGLSGDGGLSDSAEIYGPSGITFGRCMDLYIGQVNFPRIRKVTFPITTPTITLSTPLVSAIDSTVTVTASVTGGCCYDTIIWMNNGMVFATTTTHIVSYVKTAAYDTITAKVVGCGDSATSVVHVVTATNVGVPGMQLQAGIRLWPNPATTIFNISASCPIHSITIANLLGQTVLYKQGATEKMTVDVGQLQAGIYVLKVVDNEGNTMIKQLIKE